MLRPITFLITLAIHALSISKQDLILENIALRLQVTLLKEKRPYPRLDDLDRGF